MPDFTAINNLRLKSLYASEEKFSQVQSDVDFLTELFEVENQGSSLCGMIRAKNIPPMYPIRKG